MFQEIEDEFSASDGMKLRYHAWLPASGDLSRSVIIHHGFGEHSKRYSSFVQSFEDSGIAFFSYDARGHGHSPGVRGDADHFHRFAMDLEIFLSYLKRERKVHNPILLGHSMGGAVVLDFTLRHSNQWDLRGVITTGASLKVHKSPLMVAKEAAGRVLHSFAPTMVLSAGLNPANLSHDTGVVSRYREDPLVHGKLSVRLGLDLLKTGNTLIQRSSRLKIPLLMAHGQEDRIADPEGSIHFFQGASSSEKSLMTYPELYHEILNEAEPMRSSVIADIRNWMESLRERGEPPEN